MVKVDLVPCIDHGLLKGLEILKEGDVFWPASQKYKNLLVIAKEWYSFTAGGLDEKGQFTVQSELDSHSIPFHQGKSIPQQDPQAVDLGFPIKARLETGDGDIGLDQEP